MTYKVIDTEYDTISSEAKTLKRAIFNLSCATGYDIYKIGSKWAVLHYEDSEDVAYFCNTRERAVWEIEYRTGYAIVKE
jgi:hypothetical protein|tara:strand:- start:131 stop:367 length:237 start_codon:yes stop_codon:yes gene_type:complete